MTSKSVKVMGVVFITLQLLCICWGLVLLRVRRGEFVELPWGTYSLKGAFTVLFAMMLVSTIGLINNRLEARRQRGLYANPKRRRR